MNIPQLAHLIIWAVLGPVLRAARALLGVRNQRTNLIAT